GRVAVRPPRGDEPGVRRQVESPGPGVYEQGHEIIDDSERQERQKQPGEYWAQKDEPSLADQQSTKANQRRPDDQSEIPVGIARLLFIGRRGGQAKSIPSMSPGTGMAKCRLSGGHDGSQISEVPHTPRLCIGREK